MHPKELLFVMLDAMGTDLTDCPWWFEATKTRHAKLPVRLMGATIVGPEESHIVFLISEFNKGILTR